jgi:hypothetical protein
MLLAKARSAKHPFGFATSTLHSALNSTSVKAL